MPVTRDVLEAIHQRRSGPNPGSDLFSTVDPFSLTPAEQQAGITPGNYAYAPGPYIDARRYGTDPTGVNDSTSGFQAAINVAQRYPNGATIIVAPGSYLVQGNLTITKSFIYLLGSGRQATQINFAPSADGILLAVGNGASTINQGGIRDLALWSADSTHTKTAIDLSDVSGYLIDNVLVGGSVVSSGAQFWSGGTGSVALRTHGRDTTDINNFFANADKPLVISPNPNSSISLDHWNFRNFFPLGNGFPLITVESGCTLTQVEWCGIQPWVRGTTGFSWVDATTPGSSNGVIFENVRRENSSDATQYAWQIDVTSPLQNLVIRGGQAGACKGFHLRNIAQANFQDFYYTDNAREAMNADGTCGQLNFNNFTASNGSTANLSGLMVVQGDPTLSSQPVPYNGLLMPSGSFYQEIRDETASGTAVTLAASATMQVGLGSQIGMIVVTDESTQVVGTFFLKGTNHAAVLGPVSDSGFFSITSGNANTINCYWDGSSHYVVQNGYAVSKTVRISGKVGKT